ncbi:Hypothetical predicted protein [Marmota monax]|uniref:Uncharacterized protein n=1 Tax=Marmota monax TaxID=9995 RepID=A0A5E4CRV3_MARMO|nr:Hypothetical predicted protein [Marmota monax]
MNEPLGRPDETTTRRKGRADDSPCLGRTSVPEGRPRSRGHLYLPEEHKGTVDGPESPGERGIDTNLLGERFRDRPVILRTSVTCDSGPTGVRGRVPPSVVRRHRAYRVSRET